MKKFSRQWWIKLGKRLLYVIAVCWVILFILEGCYRLQLWDFYKTELNALNAELESEKPAILVMGDSFSADMDSWVGSVRNQFPDYKVVNSAVPGTGVVQAHLMAKKRFNRFRPKVFIYQVYVGNDLFDITFPKGNQKTSTFRKTYWKVSNYLRVLNWINYKSGQFMGRKSQPDASFKMDSVFDPASFSAREQQYFQAEPEIISNHVFLKKGREKDMAHLLKRLQKILDYCPDGECEAVVLVIPQCAQVSEKYYRNMVRAGARISEQKRIIAPNYPFLDSLAKGLEIRPNVHILNPLPLFQAQETEGYSMYYPNDIHLNPNGQTVLGKWVSDTLQFILSDHQPRER